MSKLFTSWSNAHAALTKSVAGVWRGGLVFFGFCCDYELDCAQRYNTNDRSSRTREKALKYRYIWGEETKAGLPKSNLLIFALNFCQFAP